MAGRLVRSNKGSVRLFDGDFYDLSWKLVFTPLDKVERRAFLEYINQVEAADGKVLVGAVLEGSIKRFLLEVKE